MKYVGMFEPVTGESKVDVGWRRGWTASRRENNGPSALGRVLKFLRTRRGGLLAVATLLVTVIALASGIIGTTIRAIYLFDGLSHWDHRPRVLHVLAHQVARVRHHAKSPAGVEVEVDIYRPQGAEGPWPAVLLMPGFDRLGLNDPYVVGLARLLAGMGLVVSVPNLSELFEYRWSPGVGDKIAAAFDHMANLPDVRPDRLGLFGISISGGLALGAATRPAIAGRLSYSIALAPFHDYARMFRFIATGCRHKGDTDCATRPSEFGRRIFLFNYLHLILPPSERDYSTIREILRLRLHQQPEPVSGLVAQLSPLGREVLGRLEAGDEATLGQAAELAINELKESAGQISPHANLCNLRGEMFIVHSLEDNVIPYSESVRLFDQCQQCGDIACNLLTTELYGHVDPKDFSIRKLLDHLRFLVFVHRITRTMLSA